MDDDEVLVLIGYTCCHLAGVTRPYGLPEKVKEPLDAVRVAGGKVRIEITFEHLGVDPATMPDYRRKLVWARMSARSAVYYRLAGGPQYERPLKLA